MTIVIAYNGGNPVEFSAACIIDERLKELMPDAKRVTGPLYDNQQAIVYENSLIQLPQGGK